MIQRIANMGILSLCLDVQSDESIIEKNGDNCLIVDLDSIHIEKIREIKFPIIVVNVDDND